MLFWLSCSTSWLLSSMTPTLKSQLNKRCTPISIEMSWTLSICKLEISSSRKRQSPVFSTWPIKTLIELKQETKLLTSAIKFLTSTREWNILRHSWKTTSLIETNSLILSWREWNLWWRNLRRRNDYIKAGLGMNLDLIIKN